MTNKSSLIPFAILVLAVLGCGRFTQQANTSTSNGTNLSETRSAETGSGAFTLTGKEWKTHDLTPMDISVELPGEPVDKTPPESMMPAGSKEIFNAIRIQAYDEKDFASSYSQLDPTGKRSFTIKELGDTGMSALKRQARDLEYTVDVKSPSNAKYNGSFTRNGKNYELKGCVVYQKAKPERVWSVITVYPTDSSDGKTASERIIQSAAFKGSSEECE